MKVLVVSPTCPLPLNMGSRIRIFETLRRLTVHHEVSLLCLDHGETKRNDIIELEKLCSQVRVVPHQLPGYVSTAARSLRRLEPYRVAKFSSLRLRQELESCLSQQHYDTVWLEFISSLSYLPSNCDSLVVVDQHINDVRMWEMYARHGSLTRRIYAAANGFLLSRFLMRFAGRMDLLVSVSDLDASYMRDALGGAYSVVTAPNGVDLELFRAPATRNQERPGHRIVFVGSMDIDMNVDAVCAFCRHVLPLVRERVPDVQFFIVGRRPVAAVQRLARLEGVTVTGTVESVRPYYESAAVAVMPFRFRAATKLKVPEAMAMGVPVVSTPEGVLGIKGRPGVHYLVARHWDGFADMVTMVLRDRDLARRLSTRALSLCRTEYSWSAVLDRLILEVEEEVEARREAGFGM